MTSLLQSPKDRTTSSKELYLIWKAAYAIDIGSMRIRLKAYYISSLVNTNDLANQLSISVIRDKRY